MKITKTYWIGTDGERFLYIPSTTFLLECAFPFETKESCLKNIEYSKNTGHINGDNWQAKEMTVTYEVKE